MLQPSETSYFSTPAAGLDPRIFKNGKLQPKVRNTILQILLDYLNGKFIGASAWSHAWLAGSGVSYQWAAHRDPGDLDCLVGVDFPRFREANPSYRGLSDKEISKLFNEGFYTELQPRVERFMGSFELTFYVNTKTNILDIKPYAAYSLTEDSWTVAPTAYVPEVNPEWEVAAEQDRRTAVDILAKYLAAKSKYSQATNDAVKANTRAELKIAQAQAISLFEQIHSQRSEAFSPTGGGYTDFNNYRWQAGKRSGVIQALRHMKDEAEKEVEEASRKTYGVELPAADVLVRRAAVQYSK